MTAEYTIVTFSSGDLASALRLEFPAFSHTDPRMLADAASRRRALVLQPAVDHFEGVAHPPLPLSMVYHDLVVVGVEEILHCYVPSGFHSLADFLDGQEDPTQLWRGIKNTGHLVALAPYRTPPWAPGGHGPRWPRQLGLAVRIGLLGDLIRLVAPHTEADEAAILFTALAMAGACIGRGPHLMIEATLHHAVLHVLIIGKTATARKGTSYGYVRRLFDHAEPDWVTQCACNGLSTGEGLIHRLRDARNGLDDKGREVLVDPGIAEKRLFVVESEFGRPLSCMHRESNTLSHVLRAAWDCDDRLQVLTKTASDVATGAHIGLVAHITEAELRHRMRDVEIAGGSLNRFATVCSKRSKSLPLGLRLPHGSLEALATRLKQLLARAREIGEMQLSAEAKEVYSRRYEHLMGARPGILDAATSRSAPMALRIAMIYALLDGCATIEVAHLLAGLEATRYVMESAHYILGGGGTGNRDADKILAYLLEWPHGVARHVITGALFSGHIKAERLDAARDLLLELGLITTKKDSTGGRSVETWYAVSARCERSEGSEECEPA